MDKISKRGFDEEDKRWFSEENIIILRKAQEEIKWLIDREYKIDPVVTFVGDRYQFSNRQRIALKRAICTNKNEIIRKSKALPLDEISNEVIHIDGFNLIITLEVALSGGTLIVGNDGNVRDLAGLRGTYKLIDKTTLALELIGKFFKIKNPRSVIFYLDSPVSNSGKLRVEILEILTKFNIQTEVKLVRNADVALEGLEGVVSSDAIVLDKCKSYFNIVKPICETYISEAYILNFL